MKSVRRFILLLFLLCFSMPGACYATDSITMEKADWTELKQLIALQKNDLTTAEKQLETLEKQLTTAEEQSTTLEKQLTIVQTELDELTKSYKEQTKKTESEKNKNKIYRGLLIGVSAYCLLKK